MNNVTNPKHYEGSSVDCMTSMRSMLDNYKNPKPMAVYWCGCAFKYLWRWTRKNGLEDLKKCRQCIDYAINEIEK